MWSQFRQKTSAVFHQSRVRPLSGRYPRGHMLSPISIPRKFLAPKTFTRIIISLPRIVLICPWCFILRTMRRIKSRIPLATETLIVSLPQRSSQQIYLVLLILRISVATVPRPRNLLLLLPQPRRDLRKRNKCLRIRNLGKTRKINSDLWWITSTMNELETTPSLRSEMRICLAPRAFNRCWCHLRVSIRTPFWCSSKTNKTILVVQYSTQTYLCFIVLLQTGAGKETNRINSNNNLQSN